MDWEIKKFKELTIEELFKIYRERTKVFVVEQNCPYNEVDDEDLISIHIMGLENGELKAYCRIIPKGETVHIGRVLVEKESRGKGMGRILLNKAMDYIDSQMNSLEAHIQAQEYLIEFYKSLDFIEIGTAYLDEGILHIDMVRRRDGKFKISKTKRNIFE
ncbi:GNAT family N-acetyltransferase [Anaerosphaera multitolerans]|uniref:GNAT family N-acetyltransferase n=1 Tax=Anaerosphaera multitolerans TaxID=2487351 RepID=A0A437S694_9FIRM|nr:GNAT family N-acetyltransferase [Anaerosphaera multitolerans]RVU54529.1 GNAT family N-acetyltransferase [Anaerosphaera multitolerans]